MATNKVYQIVTDRIIAGLQAGTIPWKKPWKEMKIKGQNRPRNIKGNYYRGVNWFLLGMLNYPVPVYLTYKQAQERGGQVRKGEKSIPVVFWQFVEKMDEETGKVKRIPFAKYYSVFNISQCEGIEIKEEKPDETLPEFDPIAEAEAVWENMPNRPTLAFGGNRACYSPQWDHIMMPNKEQFFVNTGYYETLFHEMGHSTAHKSRVGRKEIDNLSFFGSKNYSNEELVAELTAAFLCGHVGINQEVEPNNISYIQGWLKKLTDEPDAFIRAAGKAQKAADYILGVSFKEEKEESE